MVFENHATSSKIKRAQHNRMPDMRVSAVRVVPIEVFISVVAIVAMMLVPALVATVIVVVVAIMAVTPAPLGRRKCQRRRESKRQDGYGYFSHGNPPEPVRAVKF
jgi:uncharacterized membrane-anchored protein